MWTLANDLDLVFIVAYQRILQLTYVDELLSLVKRAFVGHYEDTIRAIVDSAKGKQVGGHAKALFGTEGWSKLFVGWEDTFNKMLRELELSAKVSPPPEWRNTIRLKC